VAAVAIVQFSRTVAPSSIKPVPFTADVGDEISPDFSPDGKQIVFIAARDESIDVFVQIVDSAARLQLTRTAEWEWSPAWSRDGRWIAFVRSGTAGPQLLKVSPIGGPEHKIADDVCVGTGLSWSADSRWLACSGPPGAGLSLIAVDSGESRRLTSIAQDAQDLAPSFAPDGRSLLYVRCAAGSNCDLYLLSLDSRLNVLGKPRRVTNEHRVTRDVSWTSDGRDAIFQSSWPPSLYRVRVFGAPSPQELSFAGPSTGYPAVSRHGNLAYAKEHSDLNILRTQGDAAERHPVNSTLLDTAPTFSPDGKRLA
jgi:Tol biopolymer transport system component